MIGLCFIENLNQVLRQFLNCCLLFGGFRNYLDHQGLSPQFLQTWFLCKCSWKKGWKRLKRRRKAIAKHWEKWTTKTKLLNLLILQNFLHCKWEPSNMQSKWLNWEIARSVWKLPKLATLKFLSSMFLFFSINSNLLPLEQIWSNTS